jgi:threonine/homoserine/homoserine lactone efflux protein
MSPGLIIRGVVIGFSIAAPVGPIGVLCIRRTLADGRTAGLVTGLGAATADAIYGSIAAFGLTALSDALVGGQLWIRLIGGAYLLALGVRTFVSRPGERPASATRKNLLAAYGSTFVLTLTNPMTILSFVAVFAALGLGTTHPEPLAAAALVGGVFLGSALWWLTLSGGVGLLRSRFDVRSLEWVNRLSGTILIAFGGAAVASLLVR